MVFHGVFHSDLPSYSVVWLRWPGYGKKQRIGAQIPGIEDLYFYLEIGIQIHYVQY